MQNEKDPSFLTPKKTLTDAVVRRRECAWFCVQNKGRGSFYNKLWTQHFRFLIMQPVMLTFGQQQQPFCKKTYVKACIPSELMLAMPWYEQYNLFQPTSEKDNPASCCICCLLGLLDHGLFQFVLKTL